MKHLIELPEHLAAVQVLGVNDELLGAIECELPDLDIWVRERELRLSGSETDVARATALFGEIIQRADSSRPVTLTTLRRAIESLAQAGDKALFRARGKVVATRSTGQQYYSEAIEHATVIFGIGPAGTGKTFLAMAHAVKALFSGQVRRIVLTRPAVEAGENLGFLPGSLTEKIDPYLRPLYDALRELIEPEELSKLMDSGTIEVAPLAYMRGRTLNDAFIVLDEAQNASSPQMKMFLTRLGFGSKMVVTGDISQIDLPRGTESGLVQAERVLRGVPGIEICVLDSTDVVRHQLVGRIIEAYDSAAMGRSGACVNGKGKQ